MADSTPLSDQVKNSLPFTATLLGVGLFIFSVALAIAIVHHTPGVKKLVGR